MVGGPSFAHSGNYVFQIYELPTAHLPVLGDGMADWEEELPMASLGTLDFASPSNSGGDPEDFAIRAWLAWHAKTQRIYVGVQILDDYYVNSYAGGALDELWQYDSIEFMIDGDHSGGQYGAFAVEELGRSAYSRMTDATAQQYTAIAQSPDGRILGYGGAGGGWVTRPPYADIRGYAEGEAPHVSTLELFVTPWDDLDWTGPESSTPSHLEAGRIVGFHMVVYDYDEVPGPVGALTLLTPYSPYRRESCLACSADEFLDAELVPCNILDCGSVPAVSVVEGDSWAKIKAGLRK